MKNNKCILLWLTLFLCACHHIDDAKYEEIYLKDFKKDTEIQQPIDKKAKDDLMETKKKSDANFLPQNVTKQTDTGIPAKGDVVKSDIKPTPMPIKRNVKIGELNVESDHMTFNKETSLAIFSNNVRLESQGVLLFCDTLKSVNYRDNAEAIGNVVVNYKEQKVKIKCEKVKYNKSMSKIEAYGNVVAEKTLDNNEKVILFADEIKYDVETGEIVAIKVDKKVKIKLKDIVAFSDKVIYNELKEELELTGNPFAKKQESTFISSKINIDVNKRIIKLKENIWAKVFYSDFEDVKKEVESEKNSN
ncbi:MAG: hypothetical protein KA120_03680 [Candidatus Goldbacteria bacterium]|nr:hypothetical protein [Candidatus Goldiibacteriota bacterium]